MGFGKNILKKRLEKGFSKEYVAVNVGCTVASLNSWESEVRNPTLKKAKLIADFFGVTVSDLMDIPNEQLENAAQLRLDPDSQASIDRIRRMREAGLTEAQIDKVISFAIENMGKK